MKKLLAGIGVAVASCLLIYLSPTAGLAATYYVDNNHASASDANPGTIDLPWLTIQHASETMVAGDTVLIRTGTYNEHVYTEHDGNSTAGHIVFSAYPGEAPIIDGTGITNVGNLFIVSQPYIKLIGLEIRNFAGNGIWIENAAYIEISDCELHDVEYGIGISEGTHDFELNRVELHHFDYYGFDVSPDGVDCYNGTFNDCIAHTWRDPSLGHECDGFALSHDGAQHDFVLNRCEAHTVGDGFVVGGSNVTVDRCSAHDAEVGFKMWGDDITIVNCLSYHNESSNVELDWSGEPSTTTLRNCTLMDAESYNIWVENSSDSLHMYNCIVAGSDNIGLSFEQQDASTYRGDYNIFHDDDGDMAISVGYEDEFTLDQIAAGDWTAYSGQDAHSLVVYSLDELFADPATFDLHVLETSAAVDNGTATNAPSEDYAGNPRPSGAGYDIGAYEYQFDGSADDGLPGAFPGTYLVRSSPNPFGRATIVSYSLPRAGMVRLGIYDLSGRLVRSLVNGSAQEGSHQVVWDGCNDAGWSCAGGLYLCRLQVDDRVSAGHLVLAP